MACNLTLGRSLPCKDVIGGIKALYFLNGRATVTYNGTNTEQIDDIGTVSVYKYELPNNSGQLINTGTVNEQNGTGYFAQSLTVNLPTLSRADHKELKLMQSSKPTVFVLDNNDNVFAMGIEFGCMIQVNAQTGTAKGDMSGYAITITAEEKYMANFLIATGGYGESGYPFDNVTTGTVTIV